MNYELMARLLTEKQNTKFTAELIKKLDVDEASSLIFHLSDCDFLKTVASELEDDLGREVMENSDLIGFRGVNPGETTGIARPITMEEYCNETEKMLQEKLGLINERLEELM